MIYTIGHNANYLQAIANSPEGKIYKTGKRDPGEQFPNGYEGGYAFQFMEDAQKRIDEAYPDRGFAIFGLLADWETETEPSESWWHYLLIDAEIIVL